MAEKKFTPFTIVAGDGISGRSRAAIQKLDRDGRLLPQEDMQTNQQNVNTKDPRATIQLPDGRWVTPEQHQQLMIMLQRQQQQMPRQ
jgi:hypothetical protein